MSEAPKLLPCPFCGDPMELNVRGRYFHHVAQNPKCPIRENGWSTEHIDRWNTRDTTHALAMVAAATDPFKLWCKLTGRGFLVPKFRAMFDDPDHEEMSISDADLAKDLKWAVCTPADEQAALDAMLKAERVKALREALSRVPDDDFATASARQEILALIEKETGQ